LSDRILIAENWCAALFVSTVLPDSETAALQCGRAVDRATVHPPGYMDKAPRLARCRLWRTHAPSSLQNIRLSADVGNSLSSRNSWADGDGCVGARDADIARRRAQRCHGFPVSARSPKTVGAAFFVFTRVIDRRCSAGARRRRATFTRPDTWTAPCRALVPWPQWEGAGSTSAARTSVSAQMRLTP
jgi:hypothetical protein